MRPEGTSVGKTPTAPASGAGSAAGLGVTPAELKKLRHAIYYETTLDDTNTAKEIIADYLARKGFTVWWEGLVLVAYSTEAKGVVAALKELFAAAQIPAEIVAWSSGGLGPVKIGINLPWGERA
jgi:hypothetical protein